MCYPNIRSRLFSTQETGDSYPQAKKILNSVALDSISDGSKSSLALWLNLKLIFLLAVSQNWEQ